MKNRHPTRRDVRTALLLTLALLLLLASCGKEPIYLDDIYPDSETVAPIDPNEESPANSNWQPVPEYDPTIPHPERITFTDDYYKETKHCIVFGDGNQPLGALLKYYSKATGEVHVLCGDPLCDHNECSAFCHNITIMDTLTYIPETGQLWYARVVPEDYRTYMRANELANRRYEIVSIDIDRMDFTVKRHYLAKPGDRIDSLRYDDGKLYFTYHILEGYTTMIQLDELSLADNSVRHVMAVEGGGQLSYVVKNGIVYRSNGLNILSSYDIAAGKETELYVPDDPEDQPQYTYYDGHIICADNHGLKEMDLTGKVIREIFRTQDEPHYFHWAAASDSTFYGTGYDPVDFDEKNPWGVYQFTRTLTTGGQVLRWTDGVPEVYIDFGNDEQYYYEIQKIMPMGNCVFLYVIAYRYEDGRFQGFYYYTFDGVPHAAIK